MAKVLHTCTECVPIDASIIDTYVALVDINGKARTAEDEREAAETARENAEAERTATFAEDHSLAAADHAIAGEDHTVSVQDHIIAREDHVASGSAADRANAAAAAAEHMVDIHQGPPGPPGPGGNDEDINEDGNGNLQFANREYNPLEPNGMGYKIIRMDDSLSSQMTDANTIYVIRYKFDLNSGSVTIPEGSTLRFDGGVICNGTINGQNTSIQAADVKVFDNIVFSGTFMGSLNACWVGAKRTDDTFDNSTIIQSWFSGYANVFKVLSFPAGIYYFLSEASLTTDKRDLVLEGNNSLFYVNIETTDAYLLKLQTSSGSSGEGFRLQNVRIKNAKTTDGKSISRTRAVLLDRTQRFDFHNVQIWYFDVAVDLVNIWYGGFTGQNCFRSNRIGLLARTTDSYIEVNTIDCHNVDFKGVARGTVAAIYPKNDGESDEDYLMRTASCGVDAYCLLQGVGLRGNVFESFDYGIRTNWRMRSSAASATGGTFTIDGCYFEDNRVEDIYVGTGNASAYGSGSAYYTLTHNLTISNCRFHTIKHVYLYGAIAYITSNQSFSLKVAGTTQATTTVDYDGPISIDGLVGGSATIHKIGGRPQSITASNGASAVPSNNFQRIQQTRYFGTVYSRLNGYVKSSSSNYDSNVAYQAWNFNTMPNVDYAFDILPFKYFRDPVNSYSKVMVPSGGSMVPVSCDEDYNFRAVNAFGSISLYEFIRRWNAGIVYTGSVKNLFPFNVTTDPENGTVKNESGTIVGFGKNALGTTITTGYTTSYLLFVDAMVWVRISYSRIKQYADALQCGRTYGELRGSINDSAANSLYLSCYGTNANMANVQKRLNAVYWDTTNSTLMIYNGFEWVEMTSPYQRYYYKSYGLKLADRSTMADLPGQTFTNYATGITYTFTFRANNNYKWVPSIGSVDSLEHPNGYSSDNTLDYANELGVGEMVMYNGVLYKWDGSQLVSV